MTTTPATTIEGGSRVRTLHHWVAGAERAGSGDVFSDVTDPATGTVTARLPLASDADVEAAVAAAKAAFPGWRDASLARPLLHPGQGRDLPVARSEPRWHQPRLPQNV